MKLTRIHEKEIYTKINIYKTEKGLEVTETFENKKLKSVTLNPDQTFGFPMMLNLPDNWIDEYNDFGYFYKHKQEINKLEDIKEDKIFFLYSAGHMLFDVDRNIVSIPYTFIYIGSLKERHEDDKVYKKLMKLFKKHPYVLQLEEEEIAYYNSAFEGQKGIKLAKVYIPQKKYEKLYNKYKDEGYWSVNMGSEMKLGTVTDIYGKEIENLLKEYYRRKKW